MRRWEFLIGRDASVVGAAIFIGLPLGNPPRRSNRRHDASNANAWEANLGASRRHKSAR